jgi:8-oxo-dGTP pyrophosphatase MutT (NUDIX family)
MYKVFFDNRVITICAKNELADKRQGQVLFCKNKKSFDNAYHLFLIDLSIKNLIVQCNETKKIFKHLKSKYSIVKAAGGVVINKKNELLVIKRNGWWDLPKGKIEKGEEKRVAAVREVEEECGISNMVIVSKIPKTYHTYQFKGEDVFKVTHWYKMRYDGNETPVPQTEEDITEVKWVAKSEIKSIVNQTYDSLKPLFIKVAES